MINVMNTSWKNEEPTINFTTRPYEEPRLNEPLYDGSKTTILQSVLRHFVTFCSNNGMSKSAVSMCLSNEKKVLPQPNKLPKSYKEAHDMVKHLLIPTTTYHCCVNDCQIFRLDHSDNIKCSVCDEDRYLTNSQNPRKTFTYMPLGPRLARWYGTDNVCKLLYSKQEVANGKLGDFTDGSIYESWYEEGGVFENMEESLTVPLALFTDGLNPNKSMATQKSMWPLILTWLHLPVNVRQILGPMMLVGIIPGTKTEEPKHLDPYLELIVDELLTLSECKLFNTYKGAPCKVKVALLQYQCDIPAFGKLLHVSSQAALRGCPYCRETGEYCKNLHKVVHLSNRSFLPTNHHLRSDTTNYASKREESSTTQHMYTNEEEYDLRKQYDDLPNKNQKNNMQKRTGLKGTYSFMKLPYHNRSEQMQPDGMHTIADVIGNVLDTITGKDDSKKVRLCEQEFDRFKDTWVKENTDVTEESTDGSSNEVVGQKRKSVTPNNVQHKKKKSNNVEQCVLPPAPWRLDRTALALADKRAKSLQYPPGFDYHPDKHFSKPWTLRTMHGKLQFVTSNAAAWCLHGLLGPEQERTLLKLFDVLKKLTKEEYKVADLEQLQEETHEALALIERDFPLSLQTITMHLLHHIPEGFPRYGPLYGRWLFPYERVNCWITRQVLNKHRIESTVMETYAIYDWCVFMLMSDIVDTDDLTLGKFEDICNLNEPKKETMKKTQTLLEEKVLDDMSEVYDFALTSRMNKQGLALKSVEKKVNGKTSRVSSNKQSPSHVYFVRNLKDQHPCVREEDDMVFGRVKSIFEHDWRGKMYTWVLLDLFSDVAYTDGFWNVSERVSCCKPFLLDDISEPQVIGRDNDRLFFIGVDVKLCSNEL
ncbi:Hypothetical predicted protein [Mytilus galloprovincialis]|nr:Hypothetical predicted protein [Mytilus galloprovincialis]